MSQQKEFTINLHNCDSKTLFITPQSKGYAEFITFKLIGFTQHGQFVDISSGVQLHTTSSFSSLQYGVNLSVTYLDTFGRCVFIVSTESEFNGVLLITAYNCTL